MSRWDYDTVFYRVFCITLLGVALTFTIILTNVFVDIDGILTKNKVPDTSSNPEPTDRLGFQSPHSKGDQSEDFYEDKDYQDSSDLYRSKRSLVTQDLLLQIKDPAVKRMLTNRLTTLLDELDEEESNQRKEGIENDKVYKIPSENNNNNKAKANKVSKIVNTDDNTDNSKELMKLQHFLANDKLERVDELVKRENNKIHHILADDKLERVDESTRREGKKRIEVNKAVNKDEMLHLAMHNVILQGIIGNMKMESVYKKVYDLVINFEKHKTDRLNEDKIKETKHTKAQNSEELKLLDELINCKDLQKEIITESTKLNQDNLRIDKDSKISGKHKDPNVIIKTIIDITGPNDKSDSDNILNSKANLNGIVKLVYNGKSIKFKRIDEPTGPVTSDIFNSQTEPTETTNEEITSKDDENNKEMLYKKIIQNYLNSISKGKVLDEVYTRKRLKRHVKIRYETPKPKHKKDDELFVEIETHFDSHGTKGEKKKKLIKDLIDKIKRAIHSDSVTKKPKYLHVKKRTQSKLDNTAFVNSVIIPLGNINHRRINPISKLVVTHEEGPILSDDDVFQTHHGPGFLVKKINSAELSTVDTEYDKVNTNGIPQRLQIPLNGDVSKETQSDTNILNLENIKFLVKDIEGSGFSIGFNQFQGESPDPESIKLFTGLENVLQSYHQKYDQDVTDNPNFDDNDGRNDNNEGNDDYDKKYYFDRNVGNIDKSNDNVKSNIDRNKGNFDSNTDKIDRINDFDINSETFDPNTDNEHEHIISRRSISTRNQSHHHFNKYNIFKKNLLPYDNYEDIANKGNKMYAKNKDYTNPKSFKDSVLVIDENIFEKDLKPAEIFTIADLFARRKRSVKVKKITNVRKKMNRFINTKSMATKTLFQNNKKRTKRQIDKIRIVARDSMPHAVQNSEEDIFLMSDEKVYADRAVFADRAVLTELVPRNQKVPIIEHFDIIAPQKIQENHFDVIEAPKNEFENPYVFEVQNHNNPYARSRLTSLMSKYPHIFMDATQEEASPFRRQDSVESTTVPVESNFKDFSDLMIPQDKANFKLTVKIRPKNATTNGFKEIHTSINKTYNKNGMMYTSLVNVSEVSKIEKLHKNMTRRTKTNLKKQQELLKSLISLHKNRIEDQLKHLSSEKRILDKLSIENVEPEEILNSGIEKSCATEKSSDTKRVPITTTVTTTVKPKEKATTEKMVETTRDPDKIKLLTKLDRNAHLTSEILKKIDKNTGILETFLDKILNKIYAVTEATTQKMETNTPLKTPIPYENRNYENMNDSTKNGIPFAYSYQQPFNSNNIMYQEKQNLDNKQNNSNNNYFKHDVKDELKKEPFFQPKPGEMVINNYILKNNTRFYLDALGEEYSSKMVPVATKSHMYNMPYSNPNNATII